MIFIKKIIISIIFRFFLCFLLHNLYSKVHSPLWTIFLPINESIFEHMKLLFTSFLITSILNKLIYKQSHNFTLSLTFIPTLEILLYLILFIPFYIKWQENFIFSIILLFLVISFGQLFNYYLNKEEKIKYQMPLGILMLLISLFTFTYFSYNPTKNFLFYDPIKKGYGLLP